MNAPCSLESMRIRRDLTPTSLKTILAMVGLPARGKSFISYRMELFFSWIAVETKVFNVGQHRRKAETAVQDASYFDPNNKEMKASREKLAEEVLRDLLAWLDGHSEAVAIFDATNSTMERRRRVRNLVFEHDPSYQVIFIESRCDDPVMIEVNVRAKLLKSPDYAGIDYEDARRDFYIRMDMYRRAFEAVDADGQEDNLSYIKMLNLSSHVVVHRVYGRVTTNLLPYLMALHIGHRPVWLVRMPESVTEAEGKSPLTFCDMAMSAAGRRFAEGLAAFVQRNEEVQHCQVFACTHRRALDMASLLEGNSGGKRASVHPLLNPMNWGAYEGISRRDFEEKTSAQFFADFVRDPMNTRFPGGECYADFVRRIQPVVVEIEQQLEPVVIIAPSSVLQVLYCYFAKLPVCKACEVVIPWHSIVEWRPSGAGFSVKLIQEADLAV